ncbi:MAG: glycoside hydrolase family 9 protein [Sedimentisphaerales bacterium]|nr:glycoside hydrolase family 9 protein [Sedimentisphaerales bacterium]
MTDNIEGSVGCGISGILTSQIGYDKGLPKRAIVRSSDADFIQSGCFVVLDDNGDCVMRAPVQEWGEKWGSFWWVADFSALDQPGDYTLKIIDGDRTILTSDPVVIAKEILWSSCFETIAFEFLDKKAELAPAKGPKIGWLDSSGGQLQEFSSHCVTLDSIEDIIEVLGNRLNTEELSHLHRHIINGCSYLAFLQDKARDEFGLGDGSVVHDFDSSKQYHAIIGNVAKAAMIFARSARIILENHPSISAEYLERAIKAFTWASSRKYTPVINEEEHIFYAPVHGAPHGATPPDNQLMTRDLLMLLRASVELFKSGRQEYEEQVFDFANMVMERQVPQSAAEGPFYGHFYTYSDFSMFGGSKFTEKANIHCGAWSKDGRIYNKGGHYPHYLVPFLEMLRLWPSHNEAVRWKQTLYDFAYGYLLPACKKSPFYILPAGYYCGQGLTYFGSWYHAHNNIYAFAAILALEFANIFDDSQFVDIAVGNLQWIAGLNCGQADNCAYVPISMIKGIGHRYYSDKGWNGEIKGAICNGFSASPQFTICPITMAEDKPMYLDNEAYIAHSLPYLAALARLSCHRQESNAVK